MWSYCSFLLWMFAKLVCYWILCSRPKLFDNIKYCCLSDLCTQLVHYQTTKLQTAAFFLDNVYNLWQDWSVQLNNCWLRRLTSLPFFFLEKIKVKLSNKLHFYITAVNTPAIAVHLCTYMNMKTCAHTQYSNTSLTTTRALMRLALLVALKKKKKKKHRTDQIILNSLGIFFILPWATEFCFKLC